MGWRTGWTRRQFLRNSAGTVGGLALAGAGARVGWTAVTDTIRVGVIGCGGRGSGAARNCVDSSPGVKVVALADVFGDRIDGLSADMIHPSDFGMMRMAENLTARLRKLLAGG